MKLTVSTKYIKNQPCILKKSKYVADRSTALGLFDEVTGELLLVPTVCMDGVGGAPAEGNVWIKDWSENEGVMQALIDAGVISLPVGTTPAGFATASEHKLLVELDDESDKELSK